MGAPVLRVNGFDFSPFLNVQHDDGLDPLNPDRKAPQFAGSGAFREGKEGVGQSVDNRAWTIPLVLEAANRPALHDLIRRANQALTKGATVEFAIDEAVDAISYFRLEDGRLDGLFQYYLSVHSVTRATLRLWSTPHATSGTQRLLASRAMGSSAVVQFPATGVLGDEDALANLEVRVGSAVASAGRVVLYAVHPHPSFLSYRPATSGLAQAGATVRGASGAVGSQYTAIPVSPTGASGVAYTAYLTPPDAHVGRHRLFAIARSALSVPLPLYAEDRFNAPLGPTALASQTDLTKWQLIDLGEVQVPARASGQDTTPTQYVNIYGGGASGASVLASGALHLNGVMLLPLDYSVGVLRTGGAGGGDRIGDTFYRYLSGGVFSIGVFVEEMPNADIGNVTWARVGGRLCNPYAPFGVEGGVARIGPAASGQLGYVATGATGLYTLGSGRMLTDVHMEANYQIYGGVPSLAAASNHHVALYPKMEASAAYTKAVLTLGPSPNVAIITGASPGAQNLRASAGMPSLLASGLLAGQRHKITARVLGGRMDVWVATGPLSPSPIISASHAELGVAGYPAVDMQQGPGGNLGGIGLASTAVGLLSSLIVYSFGGSVGDIAPREYFRFEADPDARVYQGNASIFKVDRTADYRGHDPHLFPVGTGASARGPLRVVVFQGEVDNVVGNDGPDVALTAMERWEYLR